MPAVAAEHPGSTPLANLPGLWFDPAVATGYDLQMISGGTFATVGMPPLDIINNADYTITAGGTSTQVAADASYSFGAGVNSFEVSGIDPALSLNPSNNAAFPVQLSFNPNGEPIEFEMTPITAQSNTASVPETSSLLILAAGPIGFGVLRRKPWAGLAG